MSAFTALSNRIFPREKIRQRIMNRVRTRRGPLTPPFELEYRHIFVLPTGFGFAFGILLIFMALGGLNFSNNMALLLVFIMGAIAQMTSLLAYRNLVGLVVDKVRVDPVFCGEPAHFRVFIQNPEERTRLTVMCGIREIQDCVDIPMQSTECLLLKQATYKRGWLTMESFRLETRYPMGMFKAWAWIFPQTRCLVYPVPAIDAPPLPRSGSGPAGKAQKGEGDQVHGLRPYRDGDSPKRIAWRASARHGDLYTREMETPQDDACVISWDHLKGMELEARLSTLTAWILMADHKQLSYSLELPGTTVSAGMGMEHRSSCLELLALYGL